MASVTLERAWKRPSLIILSEQQPLQSQANPTQWDFQGGTIANGQVLYLTDDNRSPVQFSPLRIENKRRMIDGTMRSYHVTDKMQISTSWSMMPSRKTRMNTPTPTDHLPSQITADGFGAGMNLKNWYDTHTGSFWALMVYDVNDESSSINSLAEKYHIFFESFDYTVVKRGDFNDLWDVSISLVEV